MSGGWVDKLHQQLEGGRLTCAVRAEKTEGLARGDFKIEFVEGSIRPGTPKPDRKILGQPLCADRVHTTRIIGRKHEMPAEAGISCECCWNALLDRRAVRRGAAREHVERHRRRGRVRVLKERVVFARAARAHAR